MIYIEIIIGIINGLSMRRIKISERNMEDSQNQNELPGRVFNSLYSKISRPRSFVTVI